MKTKILFLLSLILLSPLISANTFGYNYLDNQVTVTGNGTGDTINNYYNITQNITNNITETLELNTTQFETGEPATIKLSWLQSIVELFAPSPDLSGYWTSNGSSTATGNWDLSDKNFTTTGLGTFGNLELPSTTNSTTGLLTKDGTAWMHDFHHPTGATAIPEGNNVMIGNAGNFEMGSGATFTTRGSNNILIGKDAGLRISDGFENVIIGSIAGEDLNTAYENVIIGQQCATGLTTASRGVWIGTEAGGGAIATGVGNVVMGYKAGKITSGTINTFLGYANGQNGATTGSENTGVGGYALYDLTGGQYNTAIGTYALYEITTTSNNVALGYGAGRYAGSGTTANTGASNSIYIGYRPRPAGVSQTNQIVIGYDVVGKGSNTAVIGTGSTTGLYLPGDNYKLYQGDGDDYYQEWDGTNQIFNTSTGIAYFSNNVSATGFITRTSVYDKSKGTALDLIKDSSELVDSKGKIKHEEFYGYTQFETTDKSKPVNVTKIREVIDIQIINETERVCNQVEDKPAEMIGEELIKEATYKEVCEDVITEKRIETPRNESYIVTEYPHKKLEDGVLLDLEIELLRQGIVELKQQNQFLQDQINNLTGKDILIADANKRQDEALCSIKLFDWCLIK